MNSGSVALRRKTRRTQGSARAGSQRKSPHERACRPGQELVDRETGKTSCARVARKIPHLLHRVVDPVQSPQQVRHFVVADLLTVGILRVLDPAALVVFELVPRKFEGLFVIDIRARFVSIGPIIPPIDNVRELPKPSFSRTSSKSCTTFARSGPSRVAWVSRRLSNRPINRARSSLPLLFSWVAITHTSSGNATGGFVGHLGPGVDRSIDKGNHFVVVSTIPSIDVLKDTEEPRIVDERVHLINDRLKNLTILFDLTVSLRRGFRSRRCSS